MAASTTALRRLRAGLRVPPACSYSLLLRPNFAKTADSMRLESSPTLASAASNTSFASSTWESSVL